jgi:heme-degrading monooxygenase HmoA
VQAFLKTLPGFIEGFLYEKKQGDSRHNFVTTAVWESEVAFEDAKKAVAEEFKRQRYDPRDTVKKWRIETDRAVYERSPY